MTNHRAAALALILPVLLVVAGCGSRKPVTIGELEAYPGAVELRAGEARVGDTLARNAQQDAALRGAVGAGGRTEQKGYRLPRGTRWDEVRGFYDGTLKATGWESGAGGLAGGMVSSVLGAVSRSNDAVQTAMWSRGKQTLMVVMVSQRQPELVLSLSTR